MVTRSQLGAFPEAIIQIQGKTAFIASHDQRMMLAEPVENEAELCVYLNSTDVKAVKKILPKNDSRAWLRESSDDERVLTLSCGGQDVEVIRADADLSPMRNKLRAFWSERPTGAFVLLDKHIDLLKRASAFVAIDRADLGRVYYDADGKRILATSGVEAIMLEADLGDKYFSLAKDEVSFIYQHMRGRQAVMSVDDQGLIISCRVANLISDFPPSPPILEVFDIATGIKRDDRQMVAHTPKMLALYLTLKPTDVLNVDCKVETGIITMSDDEGKPKARIRSKRVTEDVKWSFRIGRVKTELKRLTAHGLVTRDDESFVHVFDLRDGKVVLMGCKIS